MSEDALPSMEQIKAKWLGEAMEQTKASFVGAASTTWHQGKEKQEALRETLADERLRDILFYLNGLQASAEREALLKELRDSYGIDYERYIREGSV